METGNRNNLFLIIIIKPSISANPDFAGLFAFFNV